MVVCLLHIKLMNKTSYGDSLAHICLTHVFASHLHQYRVHSDVPTYTQQKSVNEAPRNIFFTMILFGSMCVHELDSV